MGFARNRVGGVDRVFAFKVSDKYISLTIFTFLCNVSKEKLILCLHKHSEGSLSDDIVCCDRLVPEARWI